MATALFVAIGLPYEAVFILGERSCDMRIGPPCVIGWGVSKLLMLALLVGVTSAIGWLVNVVVANSRARLGDVDDA